MAKQSKSDIRVAAFLGRAQAREDRERVRRVAKIKKAIAGAKLLDHEIHDLEQIVFTAYGRTKL